MESFASEIEVRRALARRSGTRPEDWHLVFKARHGMRTAFDVVGAELGAGSVVTQLFTCLTAVVPIVAAGLAPVYRDVSERTASLDPTTLDLPEDARAVVCQHTYGIVDDDESARLASVAHAAGLPVVEDCAHCVGRLARDARGLPVADVSIHSFGVEKILPTHFGGAVWVNPMGALPDLGARIASALDALPAAPAALDARSRVYRLENGVLAHLPNATSRVLRRSLSRLGLMESAVSERERRAQADRDPVRATTWVCDRALSALSRLDENERLRLETVEAYRSLLVGVDGVETLAAAVEGATRPLLRFPVLLPDTELADHAIARLCSSGIFAEAWYRPELGPGVLDAGAFRVPSDRSSLPVHERLVARCVALPADVGSEGARRAVELIRAELVER